MKNFILIAIISIVSANLTHASASTEDYTDIATAYIKEGKYSQALTYINKALTLESQNPQLLEMRNGLFRIAGITSNVNGEKLNNHQAFIQAENFRKEKDFQKAIIIYQKIITEDANFSPAYLGLAIANYETKNFLSAKNNLNVYLNANPKSDFAYMLRAKTNLNIGEGQSALRDIKSADAIFSNPEYKLTEAIILTEQG